MKTRITIAIIFLLASVVFISPIYFIKMDSETSGILANLGTGFIGTVLTVLVVDWLYERRSAEDECRRIALSILLELDHAVWVWQGGSRSFHIDELYAHVLDAMKTDPIPSYTQNLFMRLGSKCVTNLNLNAQELNARSELAEALRRLSKFELIRDNYFDFPQFQSIMISAIVPLARACNIAIPQHYDIQPSAHRPTSLEHQHSRHFGRYLDGTDQPVWNDSPPETS